MSASATSEQLDTPVVHLNDEYIFDCTKAVFNGFRHLPNSKEYHESVANGKEERAVMFVFVSPGCLGTTFTPSNVTKHLSERIEIKQSQFSSPDTQAKLPWLDQEAATVVLQHMNSYNPSTETIWLFLIAKPNGMSNVKIIVAETNSIPSPQ